MLTTCLDRWVGGWAGGRVALEEWKLRLTSAKVEVEAELGNEYFIRRCKFYECSCLNVLVHLSFKAVFFF